MNLNNYPLFKQMIKFALVGLSNVAIDFITYITLTRGFDFWASHYLWANFIAFSLASLWSFIFNKNWTFRNTEKKYLHQGAKFFLVSAIGLSLAESLLFLFVSYWHFYDILAKIIVAVIVYFWNFFANRLWTFRNKI